jgi:G:T-mismatch repair DNA endonuclease (very short patch repair protein)
MGIRITTGRLDLLRFKAVIFMHPCIYHTASCKRKKAPANTNSPIEMENNQEDGRAATTKQDLADGETKSAQN